MKRTTVYLDDEELARLREVSSETGVSQSDLIRRGVRAVIGEPSTKRAFRSMATGASGNRGPRRWGSDELYEKTHGRR